MIAAPHTQHMTKGYGIYAAYQQLEFTPNCNKFNKWSPTPSSHAHDVGNTEPGTTLVEFLKSIENLQSALHDHARANPNLDITVAIDSPVLYIFAVLDYLCLKGMLITYDKLSIKDLLDMISLPAKILGSSRLSWGFLEFKSKTNKHRWLKFPNIRSNRKTFLCFCVFHCFGLEGDTRRVRDMPPIVVQGILDSWSFYRMSRPGLYPLFNLQKFEECLKMSVFLTKLTGHSDGGGIRFADIPCDEIKEETGLEKDLGEDEDLFYFCVLLGYMMMKGIIEKYNSQTHAEMMKALGFSRVGKMDVAVAAADESSGDLDFHQPPSTLPPAVGTSPGSTGNCLTCREGVAHAQAGVVAEKHSSHSDNTQGGGAVKPYPPRNSVLSLLQNTEYAN
ncbi:hypothetical protein F5876DRAFT_84764 [Lentinula aff. lateritia]|uniref:Uncharacterized protein n=1 Tax=Lentinula aff. lateritia TaxID=2804960 RepID=A0ACC1TG02_9AGAR|nr:hypothetical protein F5876DRAFT_84764 [Lentinula aff. lateritia]